MKKIALITSFCNTEEKIKILKNTINILKTLEIDTILFTGLHLPEDIYKNSDYVLISKEYPLLDWPVKSYVQWWNGKVNEYNIIMSVTFPDYGYAVLNQIKRLELLERDWRGSSQGYFEITEALRKNKKELEVFQ